MADIVARIAHLETMAHAAPAPTPAPTRVPTTSVPSASPTVSAPSIAPTQFNFVNQIATIDAAPSFYYSVPSGGVVVELEDASSTTNNQQVNQFDFIRAMARYGYFDNPILAPSALCDHDDTSDRRAFGFQDRGSNADIDNWMIFHMRAPLSIYRVRSLSGTHPGANYHGTLTLYGSNNGGGDRCSAAAGSTDMPFCTSTTAWTLLGHIFESGTACAIRESDSFGVCHSGCGAGENRAGVATYSNYMVTLHGNARGTYQHLTAIAFDLA